MKAVDPRCSLAWLRRKAGIKSKGYLADVISGRRRIGLAYKRDIGAALGLKGQELAYFETLVELEHERDPARLATHRVSLVRMRKVMSIREDMLPAGLAVSSVCLEVFSAFGLFKGQVSREQICHALPARTPADIDEALSRLLAGGYLSFNGDAFRLLAQEIRFQASPSSARNRIFKDSALQAAAAVDRWLDKRDSAHFETAIISVRKRDYQWALQRVRDELLALQSSLEASEADLLIRFNAQVFPVVEVNFPTPFAGANEV